MVSEGCEFNLCGVQVWSEVVNVKVSLDEVEVYWDVVFVCLVGVFLVDSFLIDIGESLFDCVFFYLVVIEVVLFVVCIV